MKQLILDCAINLRSESRSGTLDAEDRGICTHLQEIAGEVFNSVLDCTKLTPYLPGLCFQVIQTTLYLMWVKYLIN
jgi:hypothetical protein